MNPTATFDSQISRIKKGVWIHNVVKAFLAGVVLFSWVYGVAMGLDLWTESTIANRSWFPKLAIGGSVGCCIILMALNKRNFLERLIEIDHRLNLNDTISTAFEYRHLGKKTALSGLLIESATRYLSGLHHRKLFPPRLTWLYPLLGILILMHLFIAVKVRNDPPTESVVISSRTIQRVDAYLHQQKIRKKRPDAEDAPRDHGKIHRDLKRLVQDMKHAAVSRDHVADSVGRMLKEIENRQAIVARELGEQLKLHNIEEIPVQAMQQFEKWSLMNLKQLQKMVDRMFGLQVPETISERLAVLGDHQQLKEVLDSLLADMDDPDAPGGGSDGLNRDNKNRRSGSGNGLDRGEDANPTSLGRGALSNADSGGAPIDEREDAGAGREHEGDGGFGDGELLDDMFSPSVGEGKADGTLNAPKPIDSAKGAALQDRSLPSTKEYYRTHIRALTSIGQAKLDRQEVIREYQKEVEGILKKEEIPLNYREYIRSYFLSIGLGREK